MKLNILRNIVTAFTAIFFVASGPAPLVLADPCPGETPFIPRWFEGLCQSDGSIQSPASGGSGDTGEQLGGFLAKIAMNVVTIILYVVGYVSLAFIIVGGFKFMTQGDSSSGTVAARKTIQNAVIGLILSIASVAIVKFVAGIV